MRLSPQDGYRLEHVRTQKLSQLLTCFSLRERGFQVGMCSDLPPSIRPGQKPFGPRMYTEAGRAKGRRFYGGCLSGIYFFPQPVSAKGMSFTEKENTARASQEDSVTLCHTFLCLCLSACQESESLLGVGGWRGEEVEIK